MKTRQAWYFVVLLLIFGCPASGQSGTTWPVISYLDIPVDSTGNLPVNPYILRLRHKESRLVAIGTQHTFDTASDMFVQIEQEFRNLQPEVVINEGGNLTKKYASRNQAIRQSGELGLEKYLADRAGIKTVNGDMPDRLEFAELSKAWSKDEALFYFATERFIFPYAFGQYPGDLEKQYDSVCIRGYLLKEGIPLDSTQQSFGYYRQLYRKYFRADFSLDSLRQLDFIPFLKRGHFNEVSRTSKGIRDQYLLRVVRDVLRRHRKVLLVFGGWHILSIEPALKVIINSQPNRDRP